MVSFEYLHEGIPAIAVDSRSTGWILFCQEYLISHDFYKAL